MEQQTVDDLRDSAELSEGSTFLFHRTEQVSFHEVKFIQRLHSRNV